MSAVGEIVRRDPPPLAADRAPAPTTPLDRLIMRALEPGEPMQLRDIVEQVGGTTHQVHARLKELRDRGLVTRTTPRGAPARGPGASLYQVAPSCQS